MGCIFEVFFIKLSNGKYATATNSSNYLFTLGTAYFIIIIGIAALGIYGVLNKNDCVLSIYASIMVSMSVACWILFAFMKGGRNNVHMQFDKYCYFEETEGFVGELALAYPKNLASFFCSADCPCQGIKTNFPSTADYGNMEIREIGATTIMNCENKVFVREPKTVIMSLLGELEQEYECSGICTKEKWYYYSDVNRGVPKTRCLNPILNFIDGIFPFLNPVDWFSVIYGITIAFAIITLSAAVAPITYIFCSGK